MVRWPPASSAAFPAHPSPPSRSTTIASLIKSDSALLQDSISVSTAFYALLSSLTKDNGPSPSSLAEFIHSTLIPALSLTDESPSTSTGSDAALALAKEAIEDHLIDTVWQLDQDIDNGLLDHTNPTPPAAVADASAGTGMEVDSAVEKIEAEVAAAHAKDRAARSLAAQVRLAEFTSHAIVSWHRPQLAPIHNGTAADCFGTTRSDCH